MLLEEAAKTIAKAKHVIALTGAGISVESGIPDFRSAGGLWSKYDPMEYAYIGTFIKNPQKVWQVLGEMIGLLLEAKPNPAHLALADLEKTGKLKSIVTQNIDNLHQKAGSSHVIEYHGNGYRLVCPKCSNLYNVLDFADDIQGRGKDFPPRCKCNAILKPDVVFFGEAIPPHAHDQALQAASMCDVMLIIGTSALVAPVNYLPPLAKQKGAKLIEINVEKTVLTYEFSDYFIQGQAGLQVPALVEEVKKLI